MRSRLLSLVFFELIVTILLIPIVYAGDVTLSESYGTIQDSYVNNDSPYTVYFIKDAHCNYEAQENISKIITYLVNSHDVQLVTMEGAEGEINPVDLRRFPYEETRKIVSGYFMKQGRINGVEYYVLNDAAPVPVVGLENRDLYCANYSSLTTALRQGSCSDLFSDIEAQFKAVEQAVYTSEMMELEKLEDAYIAGDVSFQSYLEQLIDLAGETVDFDATYQNLSLCLALIKLEKNLKLPVIEQERARLVRVITESMGQAQVNDFLQENLKFRLNQVSYQAYLEYLYARADEYSVDTSAYEQLTNYKKYLQLHSSIRQETIYAEADSFAQAVFESMCQTDQQRQVHRIDNQIRLMRKAFKLDVSSAEWCVLTETPIFFRSKDDVQALGSYNPVFLSEGYFSQIETYFPVIEQFYQLAQQRDETLVRNLMDRLESGDQSKAIVVAGGYHSSGITGQLRDQNISYYVISARITSVAQSNPYASIVLNDDLKWTNFFRKTNDTLALPSWLEIKPMVDPNSNFVFGNQFKSLLISTLAWQLAGYDLISVKELNKPILRAVQEKVNHIARIAGYDMRVIELARVDDQVYVRLAVGDSELVYGLFAQADLVDWVKVRAENVTPQTALAQFQLLGGSVLVLTPEQYEGILSSKGRLVIAEQSSSDTIVRTLLTSPLSEHIIQVYGVLDMNGEPMSSIPRVAEKIVVLLEEQTGIVEEQRAVEDYLKSYLNDAVSKNRAEIDPQTQVFNLGTALQRAAISAQKMHTHPEGRLVELTGGERSIAVRHDPIQFIFGSSTVPLEIITRFWLYIDDVTNSTQMSNTELGKILVEKGEVDLGSYGDEQFSANIISLSTVTDHKSYPACCAAIQHKGRMPVLSGIGDTYSEILGDEGISITPQDRVTLSIRNMSELRKSISIKKIVGTEAVALSPEMGFDLSNLQTVDDAIQRLKNWMDLKNVKIQIDPMIASTLPAGVSRLLGSVFSSTQTNLNEYEQLDAFRNMLSAFNYASENGLSNSMKIVSEKVMAIVQGHDPRFRMIKQILSGDRSIQGLAFTQAEQNQIYHIYLYSIEYNQDNIDLDSVDPVMLAKLLQDVYMDEVPVTADSVRERLLKELRGGKYHMKLDLSPLAHDQNRDSVDEIFANTAAMDEAFANAGIAFENVQNIRVYKSRFAGLVADYRVLIERYDGTKQTIRLRVLNNPVFSNLFGWYINAMQRINTEKDKVFPTIYLSHLESSASYRYYFAEHVDGMLGDRVFAMPDRFTSDDKQRMKFQGMRTWLKFWKQALVQTEEGEMTGLEKSAIISPTLMDSLVYPEDGSEPKILGLGYSIQPEPMTFYNLLLHLSNGFNLDNKDYLSIVVSAVISVFGFERSQDLLIQASAEAHEASGIIQFGPDDVSAGKVFQMVQYVRSVSRVMQRDTVRKYVDIIYDGDMMAAFLDISDKAIARGQNPIYALNGKFAQWDKKRPAPSEVKQKLRKKRPSILTVTGGTGGNSLINAIKDITGTNMVNLVTTFDTGGQSYVWQDIFDPFVGYSYSKGDVTNVAVAYLDTAKQDLLNKRLPGDRDIDRIYPIVEELIKPSLARYPELKNDPSFLINFMDAVKKVDELIAYLRQKHREDPVRFKKPDLKKASLKNLLIEALNFYTSAYNLETGQFDIDQAMVAEELLHQLFDIDRGLVIPLSTDEGDLAVHLHTPVPVDQIGAIEKEIKMETDIDRNRIDPDGKTIYGEHYIGEVGEFQEGFPQKIDYMDIVKHPDNLVDKPQMSPRALESIQYPNLDLILVGPGSLFTSLLPHFTIKDFVLNLVNRGKAQTIVYPNNQRIELEPVKRVFIINPVYSFEDKDMTMLDIIAMIERTAQKATGNPKLRFADMFDAVVVNDPADSSDEVQEYIRTKNLDVIKPRQSEKDYLEEQGIEVYSFDLATIQDRPTRTPGFDLEYTKKLEYSADQLKLITNLFVDSTRHHKKESRRNLGIGVGKQMKSEYDRVKKIVHNGKVKPLKRSHPFYKEGLKWLEMRAKQLSNNIDRTDDEAEQAVLKRDLEVLLGTIETIKSDTMPIFSIQPANGSQAIFVDDGTHYQFAVSIPTDERGLRHGMYVSAGLLSLIERYAEQANIAESISKYDISDSYRNKLGSIAAEAMFHLYGLWNINLEQGSKLDLSRAQLDLQRINETHVGLTNTIYGTILYDELAKMASKEIVELSLDESIRMAGIPDNLTVNEKLSMVEDMLDKARTGERVQNNIIKLSHELADKLEARLSFIASDERFDSILSSPDVQEFLKQHDIDAVDLMAVDYADLLRGVSFIKSMSVNVKNINEWFGQFSNIVPLIALLTNQGTDLTDTIKMSDIDTLHKVLMGLADILNLYEELEANVRAVTNSNQILEGMNMISTVSIFQLEDIHRELVIQRDMLPLHLRRSSKGIPADILEKRDVLSTLEDQELVTWMNEHIISAMTDNPPVAESDFSQMLSILETFLESFPQMKNAYKTNDIPDSFTGEQRVIVEAIIALKELSGKIDLHNYVGVRNFLHNLVQIPIREALFPAMEKIVSSDDRKLINFIVAARKLSVDLFDRCNYMEQAIESIKFDFPKAYSRFEYMLHRQRLLPDRNIGLGDGHHGENPDRVNTIIAASPVDRISLNTPILRGVTDYIRRVALDLMLSSKDHEGAEQQKMQDASQLFSRIHGLLANGKYRIWEVDSPDGNPAFYIDDKYTYQFAAIRNNDIYFSKGLIDRMRFLWDQGQHHLVIGMLAESIVHEIGENLFESDLGDQFDQVVAHDMMKDYALYLDEAAPVIDPNSEPETMLYREMNMIASHFVESGINDVQEVPLFVYPSDIPSLRNTLREGVLTGSISIDEFLTIISGHFKFGISLGAPAELMYNNANYHPGEVLGFVREFTLPEIRGAGALDTYESAIDAMIELSQTDDFSRQKAKEVITILLTDDNYTQFIGQFSPHEIEDMMYDIIRIITNDDDPYKGLKDEYNQKALDALYEMDAMIEQQEDPLMAASLVAIAGNALDFANMEAFGEINEKGFSFVDEIGRILQPDTHLVRDDYKSLLDRLNSKPNQKIAYAIDNAGEIITDFPLLKRLLEMGHSVVLITRDKHTVNDISYSDALDLFDREDVRAYFTDSSGNSLLDGAFEITHSGSNVTGTDLRRATRSFVDIWQQADVRLLKGQGNYETLRYYPMKQDMFFLVKIKDPLATARRYAKGDVLIEYRSLNPLIESYQHEEIEDITSRFQNNLSTHERALIAEFLVFYLDHLSTQADLLTADGNTSRMRELLGQARILLDAASSVPEINTELLGIIHRKIRNDSIISEFLLEYTDLPAGLVNPAQQQNEQFVVIDFASIPVTDLSYVYELIASLEAQRAESDVRVRWVVYSDDYSVREIMEDLLRRKFYRPGMEIIGQDTMSTVDAPGTIRKVQHVIERSLTSQSIDSNSIKVLAADPLDAQYCARNNMMVLQLLPQESMAQITDFIAALISMDSFVHGGKIPDLIMESPQTGAIHSVSDILTLQGAVSNNNLLGKVLRLQPSQPAKQQLRRIEHRRVLDNAI